jgi:hypothetical protein
MYLFSVHFCPCSFFFPRDHDYLEVRVYMSLLTYSAFLLTFPCCYSVLLYFFFMSCSHLISLLCFNLLSDTIFRAATLCTHQIWCGRQHDRVCVVHFDLHQHFGPLFTDHDLRTDTKSRTHCTGVSESRRTYRSDDNTLKSASAGQDRLTFVAAKLQIGVHLTASAKVLS